MNFTQSVSSEVKIGNKMVGRGRPVFVVAEIGNNHNGKIELAKEMVRAAALAGADAVKFQKRVVEEVFTKELLSREQTHSRVLGTTYGEYRRSQELKDEELAQLKDLAHSLGLVFFVTPFDLKGAKVLSEIGMDAWKVSSFDVTFLDLVEYVSRQGDPVILSTGMATLEEIDAAVKKVLAYNNQLVLNHCVSVYPTPNEDLNLGAVGTLIERYNPVPVGYSGHEIGYFPTVAAVALGACTIERHFTLDKSLPGPDHATVSLEPHEFADMVKRIRIVEKAVADKGVYLHKKELTHRNKHGKSVASKCFIPAGATITADMLVCKSPGYGIRPYLIGTVVGKIAKEDISEDTIIKEESLS